MKKFETLVIDYDASEYLKVEKLKGTDIRVCEDYLSALEVLSNPEIFIQSVFVNPLTSPDGGTGILRTVQECRPSLPVFLLYEKYPPFTKKELLRLGVQDAISQTKLMDQINTTKNAVLLKSTLSKHLESKSKVIEYSVSSGEQKFIGVPIYHFFSQFKSIFDVFVKLDSGKLLKILNANENFNDDRLKSYIDKGTTHFFIPKSSVDRCLSYCDSLNAILSSHPEASLEMRLQKSLNDGTKILKQIEVTGMNAFYYEYATDFINHVKSISDEIQIEDQPRLTKMIRMVSSNEHSMKTTFIASLLTIPLKIKAQSAYKTIGLTAMLHDIGLVKMPKHFEEEDLNKMTEEEQTLFKTHPKVGSDTLDSLKNVDAIVSQAVLQHHERRDGTGFPSGKKLKNINRVAEIVGISEEFVKKLEQMKNQETALLAMKGVYHQFSTPIVDAFKTVFAINSKEIRIH